MCDVAMPADYEMMVARGPAVYGRSPPLSAAADLLAGLHLRCDASPPPPPCRHRRTTPPPALVPIAPPPRPILVARPGEEALSPTRLKKRVVFADDRGLSLTQIRVMTEPSNVPPTWTTQFLAQLTRGISADATCEPWEVTFPQPASDYVDFRHRLDTDHVSLENVIVRESEDCIVGTVKVRNLSFRKEVLVRFTVDDWATHEDAFCTYVDPGPAAGGGVGYALYDTFSFRLTPPPRARRLQFCVCYRCEAGEFWDNGGGKNYLLVKRERPQVAAEEAGEVLLKNLPRRGATTITTSTTTAAKCADATRVALGSWSEFASWHHLDTDGPYW